MTPEWVYGTLLLLALVHLVAVSLVHARRGRPGGDAEADERFVGEDAVKCPECGAENDREYRFCRSCVAELPGRVAFARSSAATRTGRIT